MEGLDLLLAVAGAAVTALVAVGMVLLVPPNEVPVEPDEADAAPRDDPART